MPGIKINLSAIATAQLDQLIAMALKERSNRKEEVPEDPPQASEYTPDPGWRIYATKNGHTPLLLRHPGAGWLGFMIPPNERAAMIDVLSLQHRGISTPAPVDPSTVRKAH